MELNTNTIHAPLYWYKIDNEWWNYTLNGLEVTLELPVMHVSFYRNFAYSEWKVAAYLHCLSGK
jgi:formylglycine-generating enzyme required for sulfatase activity